MYEQPQHCFFVLRGDNYCPGWAIEEAHLPCSEKCRGKFYLVRDATGETWWIPACKVSFRGQSHHFQTRTGESFDWNRIVELSDHATCLHLWCCLEADVLPDFSWFGTV